MKRKSIYSLVTASLLCGGMFTACTDDFEDLNTSDNQFDPNSLDFTAQFQEPMTYCYPPHQNTFQYWTNLTIDLYGGYFMCPNGNFLTGRYGINRSFNGGMYETFYLHIFNNTNRLIPASEEKGYYGIAGMLKIVQAYGTLMTTDSYGPIAYTSVQSGTQSEFTYDSQRQLYKTMFDDLESAINALKAMNSAEEKTVMAKADFWCGGDVDKWIKVANTLRLRMALRMSKRESDLMQGNPQIDIKKIAEDAINGGLLTAADGDITIAKGLENEMWLMFNWGDCGFNANLATIMDGTNDPRLPLYMRKNTGIIVKDGYQSGTYKVMNGDKEETNTYYFKEETPNDSLFYNPDENNITAVTEGAIIAPDSIYIGMRYGTVTAQKPNAWSNFSGWIDGVNGSSYTMPLPIMKCAEAYFLQAEAKLRWNLGQESVEQLYIDGIKTSMDMELAYRGAYATQGKELKPYTAYPANAVEDYINNTTDFQKDFVDPANNENNSPALNKLTIKWDEGATDEQKLQRIITQKWLATFPFSTEAWADYRRTGYPLLFPSRLNESNGQVTTEEGARRLLYSQKTLDTYGTIMNTQAIPLMESENSSTTHHGDVMGARVYWDKAGVGNF